MMTPTRARVIPIKSVALILKQGTIEFHSTKHLGINRHLVLLFLILILFLLVTDSPFDGYKNVYTTSF